MRFSEHIKNQAWTRAHGTCECTRPGCPHHTGRCGAPLLAGMWHAHARVSTYAGGEDTSENCEVLCEHCDSGVAGYNESDSRWR